MIKLLIILLVVGVSLSDKWDYLTFTQLWPPTFCKFNKCNYDKTNVTGWNIHGLWPSNITGKDPSKCKGDPFNINALNSIYQDLQVQWANLLEFAKPDDFWKHEWTKHGVCAVEPPRFPNELSYFNNSLQLKYFISLDKILSDNNIHPSDDKQYDTESVSNLLSNKFGVLPKLECIEIEEIYYLSALEICFNHALEPISCPKRHHDNADSQLKDFIHQIFQRVAGRLLDNDKKPINMPCNDNLFYIPV